MVLNAVSWNCQRRLNRLTRRSPFSGMPSAPTGVPDADEADGWFVRVGTPEEGRLDVGTLSSVRPWAARTQPWRPRPDLARLRGPGWYPADDVELAWAVDVIDVMRRVARRSVHASLDRVLDAAVHTKLRQYQQEARAHDPTLRLT